MKTNFWIYLSCLLFCAAIGHRVWEYRRQNVICRPLVNVLNEYQSSLSDAYWYKMDQLKDNIKKKMNFAKYRDSLAVINYFLDNNEIDKLTQMCNSKAMNKDEIIRTADLPVRVQKYRYVNLLLDYYCSATNSEKKKTTIEIESEVVGFNEMNDLKFEIEFDFYSLIDKDADIIYTIDGAYIPNKLGGCATKFKPSKIDALIKYKGTGERKKYEFNNIKV